jgi:20S proteasome alpha/beta subunit
MSGTSRANQLQQLALRIFTENVVILAVENQLVSEIPQLFTTEKIVGMDDATVEALAAESPDIQEKRRKLQRQLDQLNKGVQLCRKCGRKRTTLIPTLVDV